jgi:glycosyltransferase involved in cell wall biosynthesis
MLRFSPGGHQRAARVSIERPLLSVIIPAYNVQNYIAEAIMSALAQTVSPLEVIVVNDGSTDNTLAVAKSVEDPRLLIVDQPNAGLGAALNSGLKAARGRFLGFLDGDDFWAANKAERHLSVARNDMTIGAVYSDSQYIDEAGRPTGYILGSGPAEPDLPNLIRRNHAGNGSATIVSRACIEAAGPFDSRLRSSQEHELLVRILARTRMRVRRIPEALTFYRVRANSITMDFQQFLENCRRSLAIMQEYVRDVPPSVFREALAADYRIASRKAASVGRSREALRFFCQALRLSPSILVSDPRTFGTLALICLGRRGESILYRGLAIGR